MKLPRALITGITGQDGRYLTDFLLEKGYEVHGLLRPGEQNSDDHVLSHFAEVTDPQAVASVVAAVAPDECYHMAAQSFVPAAEISTFHVNADGTLHVLEALRLRAPGCRFFLAGSSEMFGDVDSAPQDENTPLRPRNLYGASKAAAYHVVRTYRRQYGFHASCAILYNHESPRRSPHFVTRKITRAAAAIRAGLETELRLGNLDAVRDWSHARDAVRAMWLMLQQPEPDDYVIATGTVHSVGEFTEIAFRTAGLNWADHVISDPQLYRPSEPVPLIGNTEKAHRTLGWSPEISFEELVSEMVRYDLTLMGVPLP